MKYTTILVTALALINSSVNAVPVEHQKRGVVAMAVHHRHTGGKSSDAQKRKRSYVKEPLQNQIYQYTADISIGSPAQEIEVLLDTGSSDLWVYSDKATPENGYKSGQSSSYKYLEGGFKIQYVSGAATGNWVTDTVALDGATVEGQQFAVVDEVNTPGTNPIGIFGIGFTSGESDEDKYPNFPQKLVDNKVIARNAYSLYLDDVNAQSGQVLFGGVDTKKFNGNLEVVPIVSDNALTVDFSVEGANAQGVLDCGTSLTYLPKDAVSSIVKRFGATYDPNSMLYYMDNIGSESVEFKFGGATITVPASEMVLEATAFDIQGAPKKYVLAVVGNDQSNNINLLGDSFLRSAYVVYDLANKKVAIAQASYSEESDIQEMDGGTSIPGTTTSTNNDNGSRTPAPPKASQSSTLQQPEQSQSGASQNQNQNQSQGGDEQIDWISKTVGFIKGFKGN